MHKGGDHRESAGTCGLGASQLLGHNDRGGSSYSMREAHTQLAILRGSGLFPGTEPV